VIDFEQIVAIARSQGFTEKRLSSLLDINAGHLWRLKLGKHQPKPELVARAVELLGIGVGDISRNDPDWVVIAKDDLAQLAVYNEQLRQAESVLTISGSIESYLQEEWMLEFSNRDWAGLTDWEAHTRFFYPYVRQQRQARSHGRFLHRVVCPWRLFTVAKIRSIDWLDRIRFGLGDAEDVACVTPIRDWEAFRLMATARLPAKAAEWGKICVIDAVRVVVHINDKCFLSSSHESTARRLKRELDQLVKQFDADFLRESEVTLKKLRAASQSTQDRIEDLLRSREDLERAYPNWVLFGRMAETGNFVSPRSISGRLRTFNRKS
jgi:transcriptional regulator with XRE-family HTH domain